MTADRRVTFLVGAGLVCDAGLPTAVQLSTNLKDSLQEDLRDNSQEQELLSLFYFLNGAVRFQEGFLNRDPDAPVNIEQIAVAALELQNRLRNPLAPYASGWHQRIAELEADEPEILKTFVDYIYGRLHQWLTHTDGSNIAYLARFVDFTQIMDGIDIFSLNYDLCIESALTDHARHEFVNGFNEDGWNPQLLSPNARIRLFKLHGSLDWLEDDLYGVCSVTYPRHKDAADLEGEQRPFLVFGTTHKLSARQPFLTLAYHFANQLAQTQILVIIGYSFNDEYINEILTNAVRRNNKLRIILVSPSANTLRDRFPLFYNNPRVSELPLRARQSFDEGRLLEQVRSIVDELENEEPF